MQGSASNTILALAVLFGAAACGTPRDEPAAEDAATARVQRSVPSRPGLPNPLDPTPAPPFERVTAAGDTFRTADHRGRVMLVNFWATWCAPCIREIPDLVALDESLRDSGLTVVGVSMDHEGFDVVERFLTPIAPNLSYPIVLDEGLSEAYGGIPGLPTTFLVDRDGRLAVRIAGLARPDTLRRHIRLLLGRPVSP